MEDFTHSNWGGLSVKEYGFLNISSQILIGDTRMDIRNFGKTFPMDHDILIAAKVLKIKENLDNVKKQLLEKGFTQEKVEKDEQKIEEKLYSVFKKGVLSSEIKNAKVNFENFEVYLKSLLNKL